MTKKSWQNLKYLENEKCFSDEIKSIFHHFKGLSIKWHKFFWKVRADFKTSISMASVTFIKSSWGKSPLLSTKTFCGEPYTANHIQMNPLMIVSLLLLGMKSAAGRRVQISIICKFNQTSYCLKVHCNQPFACRWHLEQYTWSLW